MNAKKGDRIRLISMTNDPAPIEPGAMGTVVSASDSCGLGGWTDADARFASR